MIHAAEFFKASPGNQAYRLHPLAVSRAAVRNAPTDAIAGTNFVPQSGLGADDFEKPGCYRRVLYEDPASDIRQELLLKMVQHNGGAWGTLTTAAPLGTAGGTPEGRFVVSDGTMSVAATLSHLVKGGLFGEYFDETSFRPNRITPTPTPVTTLANGDWYWVVVEGPYAYRSAGTTVAGQPLGLGAVAQQGQLENHTTVIAAATDRELGRSTLGGADDAMCTCYLTLGRNGFVDSAQY